MDGAREVGREGRWDGGRKARGREGGGWVGGVREGMDGWTDGWNLIDGAWEEGLRGGGGYCWMDGWRGWAVCVGIQ